MSIALMTAAFKAKLSPTNKLVLLALCDCANDVGECYPSVGMLADKTCLGERSVQRALQWLEQNGYLQRELRKARSNLFRIAPNGELPPSPPATVAPPATVTPRHSGTTPPPQWHPPPATVAPPPRHSGTLNHQRTIKEPSGNRNRATRLPQGWVLPEPWRQWAVDLRPDLDVSMVADEFRDYWHGLGGQRATKCDWEATWRNWVRRSRPGRGKAFNKAEAVEAENKRVAAEWLRQFQTPEVVHEI